MKNALLTVVLASASFASYAQIYKSITAETNFFSETPVENISAVNKKGIFLLNAEKGDLALSMRMKDFDFPNKLMQEHFNENYMESEKYPNATFKGKLNEKVDFSKDGTYDVSTTGDLTIHGVTKPRTLKGKLTKAGGKMSIICDFDVSLADHNIEVPKIVFVKVAQVIKVKNKYELAVK
jgi:YceI-like domain